MSKMFILVHRVYGDFDMAYDTPIIGSSDKGVLETKEKELNDSLTEDQINRCEKFLVLPKPIKMI